PQPIFLGRHGAQQRTAFPELRDMVVTEQVLLGHQKLFGGLPMRGFSSGARSLESNRLHNARHCTSTINSGFAFTAPCSVMISSPWATICCRKLSARLWHWQACSRTISSTPLVMRRLINTSRHKVAPRLSRVSGGSGVAPSRTMVNGAGSKKV